MTQKGLLTGLRRPLKTDREGLQKGILGATGVPDVA